MFTSLFICSIVFYCFTFRDRSHQLYAELWLDFLSFVGLLVTSEMTSRLAGVVLHLWTHQGGLLLLFLLVYSVYCPWDVLLLPCVRHALYLCTLFLIQ